MMRKVYNFKTSKNLIFPTSLIVCEYYTCVARKGDFLERRFYIFKITFPHWHTEGRGIFNKFVPLILCFKQIIE